MRITSLGHVLFALSFSLVVGAQELHLVDPSSWAQQPVSPKTIDLRIDRAASDYERYGRVARIALFDIAFHANAVEYESLEGYGVMVVSVLSHLREELPPKRLYVRIGDSTIELALLTSVFSQQDSGKLAARVLGPNRWDGLFLFPVYARRDGQELVMDFARNRDGFILGRFTDKDMAPLRELPVKKPTASRPANDALMKIISREYPGFIVNKPPNSSHNTEARQEMARSGVFWFSFR